MKPDHTVFEGMYRGHPVWFNLWIEPNTRKVVKGFVIPRPNKRRGL